MTSVREAVQGRKTIITVLVALMVQAARYFVGDISVGAEVLPAISLEDLMRSGTEGMVAIFAKMAYSRGQAKALLIMLVTTIFLLMSGVAHASTWTLTDGVKTSNSCLKSNSAKSITFKVSGAANISFAIEEDAEGTVTQSAIVVDTSDELCGDDGTSFCVKYVSADYMDSVKVTATVTGGAVESVKLRCGY